MLKSSQRENTLHEYSEKKKEKTKKESGYIFLKTEHIVMNKW